MTEAAVDYRKVHKAHKKDEARRLHNARTCLAILNEVHDFRSVVDFGCGIGAWLAAAGELGARDLKGYEGEWIAKAAPLVDHEVIEQINLADTSPELEGRYDLAISLEVAEHLPEDAADRFCKDITDASDFILFSAAIPGQGGAGHINEQYIEYWVRKFWELSYVPLDIIRPRIQRTDGIYWWIRQNIVCFVKYDNFIYKTDLIRFAQPLSSFEKIDRIVYNKARKK